MKKSFYLDDSRQEKGMEEPKGPGPDLKRTPALRALDSPYGSPSRRPPGCQGSPARAPRHQLPPIAS